MQAEDATIRRKFVLISVQLKAAFPSNRKAVPARGKHHASILRLVERAALAVMLAFAVFATLSAQAQTYDVLHNFTGGADGAIPQASLVLDAAGNLYGTTSAGGTSNLGTIFKLDANGTKTVLHSFAGGTDGATPQAGLTRDAAGNFYGTTTVGGGSNSGTVFKLDANGTETVLYTFMGGVDGKLPNGPLVLDASGNLYGTTNDGGKANACFFGYFGCGVVFKLDTAGRETVLYTFTGGIDGGEPYFAGLVRDAAGNLYGTTAAGGTSDNGTVFKLDTTGTETVLYSFGNEGAQPFAGLVRDASGNLYGTTNNGGSGFGVVFKLDTAGKEKVLHKFTGGADGAIPQASLVLDTAGNLYGTTTAGGVLNLGTVFKLDANGAETVLHSFTGGADGKSPYASLVLDPSGNLYGTTTGGGASNLGTVFKIAIIPDFSLSTSGLTPSTVSRGGSSTATVSTATISAFSGSVTLSCSVQPSPEMAPKCSISPGSITPGTPAILTVSTTGSSAAVVPFGRDSALFYALCLPLIGLVATRVGRASDQRCRPGKLTSAALACS